MTTDEVHSMEISGAPHAPRAFEPREAGWRHRQSRKPVVLTHADAAVLVESGDTILIGGSGGGLGTPERFLEALAARYRATGQLTGITAVHPVGCGDWGQQGMSRLALPGLLKRQVTGPLSNSPATMAMAAADEIEAYTLPQGILSQLCRDIAAGRPGLVTHVGLGSFVDPRNGGGRQTSRASDDLVELIELRGREYLFYRTGLHPSGETR